MTLTIGIDVGGTKVAAGAVKPDGTIVEKVRRTTPALDGDATQAAIADVVKELAGRHTVEAVGLAVAGFVDEKRSSMLFSANLPGLTGDPLRADLERAVGLPVVVENDANAAAWGEAVHGAGQGEQYLVCVTVGTGIGGGLVLGGELYRGRFGVGGEIGHLRVEPDGRPCGCGNRGCWEQYASGTALVREARWRAAESRADARTLLALGDGEPEGIQGKHVTEAAHAGDRVAIASFDSIGHWLGQGLSDMASLLDPGVFVIGGGVCQAGSLLLDPIARSYRESLSGRGHRPYADVRLAELGNDAGIVGAADLARVR